MSRQVHPHFTEKNKDAHVFADVCQRKNPASIGLRENDVARDTARMLKKSESEFIEFEQNNGCDVGDLDAHVEQARLL